MAEKAISLKFNQNSKWSDVKKLIKDDSRYEVLKSSTLREKLFEEFVMQQILITPG